MSDTVRSADLQPGTRLRHRDGVVVTLARRKNPDENRPGFKYLPGWWLVDGGGLADIVIDDPKSDWRLIDGQAVYPDGSHVADLVADAEAGEASDYG